MRGVTSQGRSRTQGLNFKSQGRAVGSQSLAHRTMEPGGLSRISGSDMPYENVKLKSVCYGNVPHKLKKSIENVVKLDQSIVPNALNALERGEHDKERLRTVNGIDYYERHIHKTQWARLKKYKKDASGKSAITRGFVPLSDVEKPSMKNNV